VLDRRARAGGMVLQTGYQLVQIFFREVRPHDKHDFVRSLHQLFSIVLSLRSKPLKRQLHLKLLLRLKQAAQRASRLRGFYQISLVQPCSSSSGLFFRLNRFMAVATPSSKITFTAEAARSSTSSTATSCDFRNGDST